MRICHVIESANAGSATILAGLALDAVRRGHEVHVLYSPTREDPAITDALRKGGCTSVKPVPMRRAIGPWDVRDGLGLRRALRSLGPLDVIHSHSSKAGALARVFGQFAGVAQVYSPHGFYTMTGDAPFYIGPVERALSLMTDQIIAVSGFERRHALELGIAPVRVSVVPNGIAPYEPLSSAVARESLGLEREDFVVGFVGRLAEQKNPLDAVAAIALVPTSVRPRLALSGDGELRAEVESRARAEGQRVSVLGSRDARPLIGAFDVLLCTSRYEGLPVTFLEAINCGVPIISYPVGGTEEVIVPGETGFVVEPTPTAAAEAIAHLARLSGADRDRMARACRAMAARHTDAVMGEQTLAVYEEALRQSR